MRGGGALKADGIGGLESLLTGLILNGFPLLDLENYVILSDFVKSTIFTNITIAETLGPNFLALFGNLLYVRNLELRFAPDNCWTQVFIDSQEALKVSQLIKWNNI